MGRLLAEIRRQARDGSASGRSGSGPSLASTAARCSGVISAARVAPRRSAYDAGRPSPPAASRRRTCPTGGGGGPSASWNLPISPRWTCTMRSPANSRNRCLPAESASTSSVPSSSSDSATSLPCGLLTARTRPAKAAPRSSARRRSVWPSGIVGRPAERGVRQRGEVPGLLVLGEHADPAPVPLLAAETGGEEDLDEAGHVLKRVH